MSWLTLALLGGVVGLDATSFPQAMLSRPLIAATLAGWAFGRPGAGLLLGALIEMFSLVILPFGAARYPESGTAAAAAGAAYAATEQGTSPESLLLLALVFCSCLGTSRRRVRHFHSASEPAIRAGRKQRAIQRTADRTATRSGFGHRLRTRYVGGCDWGSRRHFAPASICNVVPG